MHAELPPNQRDEKYLLMQLSVMSSFSQFNVSVENVVEESTPNTRPVFQRIPVSGQAKNRIQKLLVGKLDG